MTDPTDVPDTRSPAFLRGFLSGAALLLVACGETAAPDPMLPVSGLEAEALSTDRVSLVWHETGQEEVASYLVRRESAEGWQDVGSSTTAEFVDEGLSPDTRYVYAVAACAADGRCSGVGSSALVRTHPLRPGHPVELTAELVAAEEIVVTWEAPEERVDTYRLDRREDDGPWATVLEDRVRSFADTDVRVGGLYGYRVLACNVSGCSDFTSEAPARVGPPLPQRPTVTEFAVLELTVRWEKPPGTTHGTVLERREGSGEWLERDASAERLRDAGLAPSTRYAYRVRACNLYGCSEPSDVAEHVTGEVSPAQGRLVVTGGFIIGTNEGVVQIVDDVNALDAVRTVVLPWRFGDTAVRGTEIWLASGDFDLRRVDLETGATAGSVEADELIDAAGLASLLPPHGSSVVAAPRPGGGLLLSAARLDDGTVGTAALGVSHDLEAFVPFVAWDGVAMQLDGEERWFLLGTAEGQPGEEIELVVVPGAAPEDAWSVPLGTSTEPASGAQAASAVRGQESLVVDAAGIAWVRAGASLHRISSGDRSHGRVDLPAGLGGRISVGPDHAWVLMGGSGTTGPGVVYRIARDLAGAFERVIGGADVGLPAPPDFSDIAAGPHGERLYVVSGHPYRPDKFPFRIWAVEVATGRLIERPSIGEWGVARISGW